MIIKFRDHPVVHCFLFLSMLILFTNLSDGLTINSSDCLRISHSWSLGAKLTADSAINNVVS